MNASRSWSLVLVVASLTCRGQAHSERVAIDATLCDLAEHPEQYIGKMVRVRASAMGTGLWIEDFEEKTTCLSYISVVVVLPEQLKPRADFDVIRDENFNQLFDDLRRGMNVQATFEGGFDAIYTWKNQKRVWIAEGAEKSKGFGKKGEYGGRIVLHRVSDILARPLPRK